MKSFLQKTDWLADFSANIAVQDRDTLFDQLFPNDKTNNLMIAYEQETGRPLPKMAFVHAFDTEAHIASRAPIAPPKMIEKMLVKEKINLTEKYSYLLESIGEGDVSSIVAKDALQMADNVLTRTDVMRAEILSTGKATVNENNLQYEIDYEVPADNKPVLFGTSAWNGSNADPLNMIEKWADSIKALYGEELRAIVSNKVLSTLCANTKIAQLIFNTQNPLTQPNQDQVKQFLRDKFNIAIVKNDKRYEFEKTDGSREARRYFPEDLFILIGGNRNEAIGKTLWGKTPEEKANFLTSAKYQESNTYITIWQWLNSNDPVGIFTKASGLFVPALKIPNGIVQAKVLNP